MANYYATARSNYFRVKDIEAFKAAVEPLGVVVWNDREDGRVGVYDDGGDQNGWPSYDPRTEDDVDFTDVVASHLADGEVAVLMEVGNEKMRYLVGYAIAINSKGEHRTVNLDDVYALADKLGENVTRAEY